MPKAKPGGGHKKWTKSEYFAHSQNKMAEKNLKQVLTDLARNKFEMRVRRTEDLREASFISLV